MPSTPRNSGAVAAQAPRAPGNSTGAQMDDAIGRLRDGAVRFAALSLDQRLALLRSMRDGYARLAPAMVEACCRSKRIVLGTPLEAEEWSLGPWPVLRHMRLLLEALAAARRGREMPLGTVDRTPDGRVRVEVFPGSTLDAVLMPSARAEVHIRAGYGDHELMATRGRLLRQPSGPRVALVLGPGENGSTAVQDVLTRMFNEGKVCLLKLHPIAAHLGPSLEESFREAVRDGYLRLVYGDEEEGRYLTLHPGIDEIHLAGRHETHERILWGDPPEQAQRKALHRPLHTKPLWSSLGGVSPVLVLPGPYLDRQLRFQAEALAGAVVHNAGLNPHTPRLLVTPGGWVQREDFLRHLEEALWRAPLRMAFYPGTLERWQQLTSGRAQLRAVGAPIGGMLPWTLIPGLDPAERREPMFGPESLGPVLGELSIGSADPIEFLQQAVGFVNERVWGTLAITVIVHPRTLADPLVAAALERAIMQLRYGAVGVNVWAGQIYAIGAAPWGAHPSTTVGDIQSGRGWTHNAAMLEQVEKVVLRQSITVQFRPAYVPGHRSALPLLRRLTAVEQGAGWTGVPGVLEAALRS